MDAPSSGSARDPLERLADEFLDRRRRGENPSPSEYARRYPELAEPILEFFPALELMEGLKPGSDDQTASLPNRAGAPITCRLEQLGEYRILREIGHGGMGIVYEAVQESLGRRVALKILPLHGRIDPVQMERFRLEARAAARLHHTGIVPVHGVGEHEGVHYYVMQYIQGHGLDIIIDDLRRLRASAARCPSEGADEASGARGSLPVARSLLNGRFADPPSVGDVYNVTRTIADGGSGPAVASGAAPPCGIGPEGAAVSSVLSRSTDSGYFRAIARLSIQVAEALGHAHQQGILHRDIKPSNLLLDEHGHVWVTDFGLAKVEGSEGPTHTGDIVGTLRYMAPERFEGWSDRRSDIYALGMTLYELLTLRPAFEAGTRAKLIEMVLHESPVAPRKHDPRVPRDLETVVLKAIAREPGERYATAEMLATDLENFVADRPIQARRSGLAERAWRWCRRNPSASALVGVTGLAVLTLVGLGVALLFQSRLRRAYAEASRQRGIAEVALDNEQTFLYTNRVIFAHRELSDHNPYRADELLAECPPERRGWEWHYLKRQCRTERLTLTGHDGPSYSVAFSADGRRIISAGLDRSVRFWDDITGGLHQTWNGYRNPVWTIALSPDGKQLASASGSVSEPDPVLVRDMESGRILRKIDTPTGAHSGVVFSSDGRWLAVAGGDLAGGHSYVKVYEAATGTLFRTILTPDQPAYRPAISRDGTLVMATVGGASSLDPADKINRVVVWDIETGRERFRLGAHKAPAMSSSFSPDGNTIASGGYDTIVRLYDASDGRLRKELVGHSNCVNEIVFSPDGKRLASASDDNTVILWDAASGNPLFTLSGHRGGIYSVAFQPGGGKLATSGYDGAIKLWEATIAKDSQTLTTTAAFGSVACLAFSHRGDLLASACADHTVKLWEMPRGRLQTTLTGHRQPVWGVAFSPDDRWIASAAGDWRNRGELGEVALWDRRTGRLVHLLKAHGGIAWTVAFSPEGDRLASGGGETLAHDDEIKIWDVASGRLIHTIPCPDGGARSVAFGPRDGELAAATGNVARIWDAKTGRALVTLTGHQTLVAHVAFNGDGTRLATCSQDASLRLWNTATGEEVGRLLGHGFDVNRLVYSPDHRRIASVGGDKLLKIWDAGNGQELLSLRGHDSYIWAVAFTPDGRRIATADHHGIVKLWDGTPVDGSVR